MATQYLRLNMFRIFYKRKYRKMFQDIINFCRDQNFQDLRICKIIVAGVYEAHLNRNDSSTDDVVIYRL